jgi:hypothetical protein
LTLPTVAGNSVEQNATPSELSLETEPVALGNVYFEDETPKVRFLTTANEISWAAYDYWGKQTAKGTTPTEEGAARIEVPIDETGQFTVIARVSDGTEERTQQTSFAVIQEGEFAQDDDPFFAMQSHYAYKWDTEMLPLLKQSGTTTVRETHQWGKVETKRGEYTYPDEYTNFMTALGNAGLQVNMVLG